MLRARGLGDARGVVDDPAFEKVAENVKGICPARLASGSVYKSAMCGRYGSRGRGNA